jgi:hypothetical protein
VVRVSRKLTYANVASTLALFLALTGGVVWAAAKIHSKDIASRAVKSAKIATHAVNNRILAPNSIGTNKIRDGSILPQDIAGEGTVVVAKLKGGSAPITNTPTSYALSPAEWTQKAGSSILVLGRINATAASDGSNPCQIVVQLIDANGADFQGSVQAMTALTTLGPVSGGNGAAVTPDHGADFNHHLIAQLAGFNCTPDSTVDSVTFFVYALR